MPRDEDFDLLLDAYAAGPRLENPDFADVDIEIGPKILAKIEQKHGLTADDVTDIVKGQPPAVDTVAQLSWSECGRHRRRADDDCES